MTTIMRAKLTIAGIVGDAVQTLSFRAVGASQYPEDGLDENNTFAKYTPQASLSMTINNPALVGKFKLGDTFYVDFTPVDAQPAAPPAEEKED